jgi:hypothetical protein
VGLDENGIKEQREGLELNSPIDNSAFYCLFRLKYRCAPKTLTVSTTQYQMFALRNYDSKRGITPELGRVDNWRRRIVVVQE